MGSELLDQSRPLVVRGYRTKDVDGACSLPLPYLILPRCSTSPHQGPTAKGHSNFSEQSPVRVRLTSLDPLGYSALISQSSLSRCPAFVPTLTSRLPPYLPFIF